MDEKKKIITETIITATTTATAQSLKTVTKMKTLILMTIKILTISNEKHINFKIQVIYTIK